MEDQGGSDVTASGSAAWPEDIEQFFQRYADDPLVVRVLMRFRGASGPLDCVTNLATPLGVHASYVRKSLLSLVLEGFVTARNHDGETTYMLTRDPARRTLAERVLRTAMERGSGR